MNQNMWLGPISTQVAGTIFHERGIGYAYNNLGQIHNPLSGAKKPGFFPSRYTREQRRMYQERNFMRVVLISEDFDLCKLCREVLTEFHDLDCHLITADPE